LGFSDRGSNKHPLKRLFEHLKGCWFAGLAAVLAMVLEYVVKLEALIR